MKNALIAIALLVPFSASAFEGLLDELVVSNTVEVQEPDVSGLKGRAARKYREQLQKQYEAEAEQQSSKEQEELLLEEDEPSDAMEVREPVAPVQKTPNVAPASEASSTTSSSDASESSASSVSSVKKTFIPQKTQDEQDELTLEQLEEYATEADANLEEQFEQLEEGFSVTSTSSLGSPLSSIQRGAILRRSVRTVGQLKLFARALAESDENLRKIEMSSDTIVMSYRQKAKLFGFLPFTYILETTLGDDGSVEVKRSWWHVIAKDGVTQYVKTLESYMEEEAPAAEEVGQEHIDLQLALQKQQQTMQMLTSISKMLHDTGAAVVR